MALDNIIVIDSLKDIVNNIVDGVLDPAFEMQLAEAATDATSLLDMKLQGAEQELIDEAESALVARAESLSQVPGHITSLQQEKVAALITSTINGLVETAFMAARAAV